MTVEDSSSQEGKVDLQAECLTNKSEQNSDYIEIEEFQLSTIKTEEDEDVEHKVVQRGSLPKCSYTIQAEEYYDVRALCVAYSLIAKQRGYHHVFSEPTLIVQCPGCFTEFKGVSDRMLRLVRHIATHGVNARNHCLRRIQKTYRSLFELMKKRLRRMYNGSGYSHNYLHNLKLQSCADTCSDIPRTSMLCE